MRKAGNHVRITAQLVKVADGFHLWSETYDRELDDIFAVQDDIARSVASALEGDAAGRKAGAPAPERRGLQPGAAGAAPPERSRRREPARSKRKSLLERALARDPKYAEAWVDLAVVHMRRYEQAQTIAAKDEALRKQQEALERALGLDPDLADAHARLARVHRLRWDFAAADAR